MGSIYHIVLVPRRHLAGHFLQLAAQYMLLNADSIKIEAIWELLRPAATAAGPNTNLFAEIVETINRMKEEASKCNLKAYEAWVMVVALCTREQGSAGVNTLQSNFMINLKRTGFLDYLLVPTEHNDDQLFQCEIPFDWDMLITKRTSLAGNSAKPVNSQT